MDLYLSRRNHRNVNEDYPNGEMVKLGIYDFDQRKTELSTDMLEEKEIPDYLKKDFRYY